MAATSPTRPYRGTSRKRARSGCGSLRSGHSQGGVYPSSEDRRRYSLCCHRSHGGGSSGGRVDLVKLSEEGLANRKEQRSVSQYLPRFQCQASVSYPAGMDGMVFCCKATTVASISKASPTALSLEDATYFADGAVYRGSPALLPLNIFDSVLQRSPPGYWRSFPR